jgi:hypothetical protein
MVALEMIGYGLAGKARRVHVLGSRGLFWGQRLETERDLLALKDLGDGLTLDSELVAQLVHG